MNTPDKHPQEIEVWYILPAIRKELVVVLKERGLTQKEIAGMLKVTEAAISQYSRHKRGKEITLDQEVKDYIREASKNIIDAKTAYREIQLISEFIKKSKALCGIHMQIEENLEGCKVCYE
jgi:predicted transcriptional regulator